MAWHFRDCHFGRRLPFWPVLVWHGICYAAIMADCKFRANRTCHSDSAILACVKIGKRGKIGGIGGLPKLRRRKLPLWQCIILPCRIVHYVSSCYSGQMLTNRRKPLLSNDLKFFSSLAYRLLYCSTDRQARLTCQLNFFGGMVKWRLNFQTVRTMQN